MGYSLAWIAVKGTSLEEAMSRQGLEFTPERSDYAESDLSAIPWGDWLLIVARRCDPRLLADANLTALSAATDVIVGEVEEHCMFSASELWRDGHRLWRVEHDAREAIDHLTTQGALPDDYEPIKQRFAAQQSAEGGADADVDHYFEIPLVLAKARVGFKHDEVRFGETEGKFVVLADPIAATRARSKSWWQFWR